MSLQWEEELESKQGTIRLTTTWPRQKNQTDCSIRSWPNNQIQIDSDNSRIDRSRLKAISANRVNVPLRAIFVNWPILCMSINTPRANIMSAESSFFLLYRCNWLWPR